MGIGLISISTNQKKEQSGPPFASGSAANGVSVDAVTAKIVLGNDEGDPAAPARLLSDREILTDDTFLDPFKVILNAILTTGVRTFLQGDVIQMEPEEFSTARMAIDKIGGMGTTAQITARTNDFGTSTIAANNTVDGTASVQATVNQVIGGLAELLVGVGNVDTLSIQSGGNGRISFRVQGLFQTMAFNTTTFCTIIQSTQGAAFNNATLQVTGSMTHYKFEQSQGAGTYNLQRDADSGKVIRNSGALTIVMPNMIGSNFRDGFHFDVLVNNAAGITIDATPGVRIRFGSLTTSVGGTLSSTDVGAFLRIMIVDSTNYVTCFFCGAWSVT